MHKCWIFSEQYCSTSQAWVLFDVFGAVLAVKGQPFGIYEAYEAVHWPEPQRSGSSSSAHCLWDGNGSESNVGLGRFTSRFSPWNLSKCKRELWNWRILEVRFFFGLCFFFPGKLEHWLLPELTGTYIVANDPVVFFGTFAPPPVVCSFVFLGFFWLKSASFPRWPLEIDRKIRGETWGWGFTAAARGFAEVDVQIPALCRHAAWGGHCQFGRVLSGTRVVFNNNR